APGASVEFEVRSVNDLQPVDGGFDVVFCFDMIHDLDDPLGGLRGIRRSLAPGGILVMMEPKRPERFEDSLTPDFAPLYGISSLHCVPQSLAGGGPGLGAAWGKKRAEELVLEAGFKGMEEREVNVPGFFQAMYVVKA
ncbi:S-adenosyl-L-methionine-dependent methyltransferase, partial [Hyaloraphidium curvatum]